MTEDLRIPEETIRSQINSLEETIGRMTRLKDSLPEGSNRDGLSRGNQQTQLDR